MQNRKTTIRAKILFYIIGSALSSSLILFMLYSAISYQALKKHIDSKNQGVLVKMERILAVPMLSKDYVMIVDLIDAETRTSNLDYIWIADQSGNIIASNDEEQIMHPIAQKYLNNPNFKNFRMKNGAIISILPNYGIIYSIGSTIITGTAISIIALSCLIIILTLKLTSKLSIPIRKVADASVLMAEGIFDISLPESNILEIDNMTSSLINTGNRLKDLSDNLEEERELLLVSEKKYRELFDNAMDAYVIASSENRFVDANNSAIKLYGCKNREELLALGPIQLSPEVQSDGAKSSKKVSEMIAVALNRGSHSFEWIHKKVSGEEFVANILLTRIEVNDKQMVQATVRDISDQKRAEEEIIQSQKMETIGTLAGGLAHDFNNVLGGIMGTLSVLKFKMNKKEVFQKDQISKYLNTIEQAGQRATDMVQQLLALSRKRELSLKQVDLNATVKNVIKICENSFDKSVKLTPVYSTEPARVKADPTQVEQVLLNFCVNAAHAMTIMRGDGDHWGGELVVSLEKIATGPHFKKVHLDASQSAYWMLSVKDSGVGMDKETVDKIFDPFFTTKDKGVGTGLGLSMAYAIVHQHNGFLTVYSEKGIGTTINFYIPVSKSAIEEVSVIESATELPKGEGIILVIDDEEIMRILAKEILEECGYSVVVAENGVIGVELYKEIYNKVKLVLLDMVMPEQSGKETYIKLKEINPDIKVLLASGFRQDKRVKDVLEMGVNGFIQKPYTMEKLSNYIYDILNEKES